MDEAARVASKTVEEFLKDDSSIREVRLVFFGRTDAETFLSNQAFAS